MTDLERAFIADIIAHPADDTPRLIYADWLTDQGQEIRAEFIRRQIAVARTGFKDCPTPTRRSRGLHLSFPCGSCRYCKAEIAAEEMSRQCKCLAGLPGFPYAYILSQGLKPGEEEWRPIGNPFFHVWRGFVRVVRCTLSTWLQHGRTIAQSHPVEEVYLTDRSPAHSVEDEYYWEDDEHFDEGERWGIPYSILCHLKGETRRSCRTGYFNSDQYLYPTMEAAIKALSAACLAWARQPADETIK